MSTTPAFHGSDLDEIAKKYGIPVNSITNFGANVNPLGLSQQVKEEVANHLDLISSYPDRNYTQLRTTIGAYCKVPASSVLVGNGSSELISLIIKEICPKKTLLLGPTYSEYERELSRTGGSYDYYNLNSENGFQLDLADFIETLRKQYDLLVLCNPNNPTSSLISTREMRQILSACKETNTFVMIDETYMEFVPDVPSSTAAGLSMDFEHFIVLRGISKFFAAPGLRLGYAITSSTSVISAVREAQIPWSLNSIGAFAGELMLNDTTYIQETRSLILSEKARMLKELRLLPHITVYDAYANFVLVQTHQIAAFSIFDYCIKKGLMIRDCSSFKGLKGEYIRFCIMNPKDNTKLLNALSELLCR
jgi:threonine-phosphate decarboxylase